MQTPTLSRKTAKKGKVPVVRRAPLESRKRPLTGQVKKVEAVKEVLKAAPVRKPRASKNEKAAPVVTVQETLVVAAEPRNELAKAIDNRRAKEEAEAKARALFTRQRKIFYAEEGFLGVEPDAIVQLDTRMHHAIANAEHGWMFDKMVHSVQVGASFDGALRYHLEQTDPLRSTGVAFSVVLDVAPTTLGGLVEEAGEGMEKFYPHSVLLEYRILNAMDRMKEEGIRFAGDVEAWRVVNAHDELDFLRKLREAFANFDAGERLLLADLVVTPPSEGRRLFGFRIGRRAARIQDGTFVAPVDVSEESILSALQEEVEKRRGV